MTIKTLSSLFILTYGMSVSSLLIGTWVKSSLYELSSSFEIADGIVSIFVFDTFVSGTAFA